MPPNAKDYFYKRWGMGRGPLETLLSFPQRAWHRLRLEDMSIEEKDHACFSNEMYKEPARRYTELRGGYTLLTDEIPATSVRSAVPLNDKRWAVYRAPNQVDHVLAFRGSADMEDMRHDVNLGQAFGEHDYMVDATVWSLRVMLMLASQHDGEAGINLKFSVTGHSLGGAVAMVVMLMLYDIPATAQHLESPDFPRFRQDVADTWHAAIVARGSAAPLPPYELVGGHIFNPGAIPDVPGEREAAQFLAKWGVKAATGVTIGLGAAALAMYLYGRHRARLSDSVDKRVTTHHILGDLLSCSFRMGAEKSYMAKDKRARQLLTASSPGKIGKEWGCHSIANFLDETSVRVSLVASRASFAMYIHGGCAGAHRGRRLV